MNANRGAGALCVCVLLASVSACGPTPPGGTGGTGGTSSPPTEAIPLSPPDRPCDFVQTWVRQTSNANCPNGVYTGNAEISSAADVQKLSGCTRVTGNLIVHGLPPATVQTLAGLESLLAINGNLEILDFGYTANGPTKGQITSLRGLSNLRCVGRDFTFPAQESYFDPIVPDFLPSVEFFMNHLLEVEGSLWIQTGATLPDPLSALRRVWGDVHVSDVKLLPALEVVYGGFADPKTSDPIDPEQLPHLEYVGCHNRFPICRDGILGCSFEASDASELGMLSACRVAVQNLKVSGPAPNLSALSGLEAAQDLSIWNASALIDLRGLDHVRHLTNLSIAANATLQSLDGLGALQSVDQRLDISDNPVLRDVHGLANLSHTGTLSLTRNLRLSDCEVNWLAERVGQTSTVQTLFNGGLRNCATPVPPEIPGLVWSQFTDELDHDIVGVRLAPDDTILVLGRVIDGASNPTALELRALSPAGERLWSDLIPEPSPLEGAQTMCWGTDRTGTITVVRQEYDPDPARQRASIYRYQSNGTLLKTTEQPLVGFQKSCTLDDAGNIYFVLGEIVAPEGTEQGPSATSLIRKQDPSDRVLWEKPLDFGISNPKTVDTVSSGVLIHVPGVTNEATIHLQRVLDDGTLGFTGTIHGVSYFSQVVRAPNGTIVALGQTTKPLDAGAGVVPLPRPDEIFLYLISIPSDGSAPTIRYLDGASAMDPSLAFGPDGSSYLFVDGEAPVLRPFVFGPNADQQVSGISVIKLDPAGNFAYGRGLSPLIDGWTSTGLLYSAGIAANADQVVVAGSLLPIERAHTSPPTGEGGFLAKLTP